MRSTVSRQEETKNGINQTLDLFGADIGRQQLEIQSMLNRLSNNTIITSEEKVLNASGKAVTAYNINGDPREINRDVTRLTSDFKNLSNTTAVVAKVVIAHKQDSDNLIEVTNKHLNQMQDENKRLYADLERQRIENASCCKNCSIF